MFEKQRLFFQSFQNLEKELLEMTDYIHFSEANLNVHSIKLADFIVKANIQYESLIKELFKETEEFKRRQELIERGEMENKNLYSSSYTIIKEQYNLDKKLLSINTEKTFFDNSKYEYYFSPFTYKKNRLNQKKIYNAIKHDRVNNIKKADLETAINILADIFILNILYYPKLIEKNDDERSIFFRGKTAKVQPVFYSMLKGVDKLKKSDIDKYLSECLYFEWVEKFNEEAVVKKVEHILQNHKASINVEVSDDFLKQIYDDSICQCQLIFIPNSFDFPHLYINAGVKSSELYCDIKRYKKLGELMKYKYL